MPHKGPQVLASHVLPNIKDPPSALLGVMFVGTEEEWRAVAGKEGDTKRKEFMHTHRSLFQVRPDVVFQWLTTLKALGNHLYSDIDIAEQTPEVCMQLEEIPHCIVEQTHIACSAETIAVEKKTV